ncbi:hypothetical protein [Planosporangium mesophilum]|uniref:hypothetical protein n=1 Tax=Planosporangium mesophilum TaxID=689768 RepID=UPI001F0FD3AF|nr:hypothetical protein [Planosporangium mesophilum]
MTGRPGVLERGLRLVVEQLTGRDQMTGDAVGSGLGETAQLVAYLRRQVMRVDVLRRGQADAGTGRSVFVAAVAPRRSAVTVTPESAVLTTEPALLAEPAVTVVTEAAVAVVAEPAVAVVAEPALLGGSGRAGL